MNFWILLLTRTNSSGLTEDSRKEGIEDDKTRFSAELEIKVRIYV